MGNFKKKEKRMSWLSIYGNAINAGMMLTQGDESGCDSSIENC